MNGAIYRALRTGLREDRPAVLATVLTGEGAGTQLLIVGDETHGGLEPPTLEGPVRERIRELVVTQWSEKLTVETGAGAVEVLVEIHPPRPQLVVLGAVHPAISLVSFARTLGFRTVVIDPRGTFATPERFPDADELRVAWPAEAFAGLRLDEGTYLALLSHDLKIDIPALEIVLRKPVRYIGALGSRRTHAKRVARLEERGFAREEIERVHNPIGLDLGGRRAEEIALAVAAEIVAVSHGLGYRPPVRES